MVSSGPWEVCLPADDAVSKQGFEVLPGAYGSVAGCSILHKPCSGSPKSFGSQSWFSDNLLIIVLINSGCSTLVVFEPIWTDDPLFAQGTPSSRLWTM